MSRSRRLPLTEGQMARRRLVALGAALAALVLFGFATLLAAGSQALDDLQAREDRALVGQTLTRLLGRVVRDTTTATVWDQAYREFRPGGSLTWADEEIGSYFAHNRGHDIVLGLDGQDAPFYAWAGSRRVAPGDQARFLADAAPLIRQARAMETARGANAPRVAPTDPKLSETASGVVLSGGVHYLVAASTVTPETALSPRRPGPGTILVSAQRMDGQLMDVLRQLQVADPRIETAPRPSPAALPLIDAAGRPVGQLTWTPERPGLRVLEEAAPAVALGLFALCGLMAALGWQLLVVARRLCAHERALTDTMRELEEARDRAEAANIAKSRFLANMSHEIRTPLNGVLGMAQVLARGDLSSDHRDKVQMIRASGEALLVLLNDILDLSKVEAGKMELDVQAFDVADMVQAATRGFGALAAQKSVRFLVDVEPAAQGIWKGDGGRIHQVLANLVANAVKFTSVGEVRVGVRRTEQGLACTVSDSGVGIASDRLERLFHRFSQGDPSATRKFGGTGLGLAISRELVELMGGRIAVTSVEGRGSAFSFVVPLEWLAERAPAGGAAAAEPLLPALRVLAAEDNATNQRLLAAMLGPLGVDLKLVADGREAVDAFAHERFDLVLMDIQMPGMNGVEAARAMRSLETERGLPSTPILAVSANVMRHQIEEYLAAGMNGFVAKPIDMSALIEAMERATAPGETAEAIPAAMRL